MSFSCVVRGIDCGGGSVGCCRPPRSAAGVVATTCDSTELEQIHDELGDCGDVVTWIRAAKAELQAGKASLSEQSLRNQNLFDLNTKKVLAIGELDVQLKRSVKRSEELMRENDALRGEMSNVRSERPSV